MDTNWTRMEKKKNKHYLRPLFLKIQKSKASQKLNIKKNEGYFLLSSTGGIKKNAYEWVT